MLWFRSPVGLEAGKRVAPRAAARRRRAIRALNRGSPCLSGQAPASTHPRWCSWKTGPTWTVCSHGRPGRNGHRARLVAIHPPRAQPHAHPVMAHADGICPRLPARIGGSGHVRPGFSSILQLPGRVHAVRNLLLDSGLGRERWILREGPWRDSRSQHAAWPRPAAPWADEPAPTNTWTPSTATWCCRSASSGIGEARRTSRARIAPHRHLGAQDARSPPASLSEVDPRACFHQCRHALFPTRLPAWLGPRSVSAPTSCTPAARWGVEGLLTLPLAALRTRTNASTD